VVAVSVMRISKSLNALTIWLNGNKLKKRVDVWNCKKTFRRMILYLQSIACLFFACLSDHHTSDPDRWILRHFSKALLSICFINLKTREWVVSDKRPLRNHDFFQPHFEKVLQTDWSMNTEF
jgi:hypothetical protein